MCLNDAYVPYACVAIQSIFDHAGRGDDIQVHVVSDYVSEKNRAVLRRLGNVHVYTVEDDKLLDNIKDTIWGRYMWYRLLLPSVLEASIHKVLYLDCDVIVCDDLDVLFAMDMAGKAIAGCLDVQSYDEEVFARLGYGREKKYVCSGVLMMNLDVWRTTGLSRKIVDFARTSPEKIVFPDQDAINYVCQDDKIMLPPKYGVLVAYFRRDDFMLEHRQEMEALMDAPAIVHYAGYAPWVYCKDKSLHSGLWWSTYKSLNAFPEVRRGYCLSVLKYVARLVLSVLHILPRGSKYHVGQYYHHPRIRREEVAKKLKAMASSSGASQQKKMQQP